MKAAKPRTKRVTDRSRRITVSVQLGGVEVNWRIQKVPSLCPKGFPYRLCEGAVVLAWFRDVEQAKMAAATRMVLRLLAGSALTTRP